MQTEANQDALSLADSTRPDDSAPGGANTRKVFIKSFGCQMNAYDGARMADLLAPEGYRETPEAQDADLIILNTCHIRELAAEKVFSELGKIRLMKQERAALGQATKIAVAGCVAQAQGAEILRRNTAVDIVVGPQAYHRLPDLLRRSAHGAVVDTDFPVDDKFHHLRAPEPARTAERGLSAFVTIQEGCDKFCTFCVVPYTRGAETARPTEAVLAEVRTLAQAGVREVSLLGQNVNAWRGRDADGTEIGLGGLIAHVAKIEGICRVRYTTSHPNDMDEALIRAHADEPALMPFLHLPVQSGSDRILDAMNRRHTAAAYQALVARVRAARPDIALSSDFIVGFPGETEADFSATLDLIRRVNFASTFFFKYSARPGTPGADLPDQVPEDVKKERLVRLQDLVEAQRREFNRSMIGRTMDVLFEKPGRHEGQIAGKSPYMQPVQVPGPRDLIGQVARVRIVDISTNSLFGELAGEGAAS